jgi:tripartite-type tricarboxylate transporter receptor subunit TctC
MKNHPIIRTVAASAVVFGITAFATAQADPTADFYKGKQINILVAFGAGGGYGIYAQLLAQYMGDHIPGHPNLVPQYMPGAGGAKAANYLYNVSPRDGSTIALLSNSAALAQVLQGKKLKYDASKFNYIGRLVDMRSAILVWHTAGVRTVADMKTHQVIFGCTGTEAQDYMNPMLMKNILGYKVKVVQGYKGSKDVNMAMEKGEVQAMSNSWGSVKARLSNWLDKKLAIPVAMVGLTPAPDLPNAPTLVSLAKNKSDRAVLELMASTTEVGRAFATPPGLPPARLAALRKAFKATYDDPKFQADAKKRNMDMDYATGESTEKLVRQTIAAPKSVVDRFIKALELKSLHS